MAKINSTLGRCQEGTGIQTWVTLWQPRLPFQSIFMFAASQGPHSLQMWGESFVLVSGPFHRSGMSFRKAARLAWCEGCSWAWLRPKAPFSPATAGARPKAAALEEAVHLPAGCVRTYENPHETKRKHPSRNLQPGNQLGHAFGSLRPQHVWQVLSRTHSLVRGPLDRPCTLRGGPPSGPGPGEPPCHVASARLPHGDLRRWRCWKSLRASRPPAAPTVAGGPYALAWPRPVGPVRLCSGVRYSLTYNLNLALLQTTVLPQQSEQHQEDCKWWAPSWGWVGWGWEASIRDARRSWSPPGLPVACAKPRVLPWTLKFPKAALGHVL